MDVYESTHQSYTIGYRYSIQFDPNLLELTKYLKLNDKADHIQEIVRGGKTG
jgi:hypothetical protein